MKLAFCHFEASWLGEELCIITFWEFNTRHDAAVGYLIIACAFVAAAGARKWRHTSN